MAYKVTLSEDYDLVSLPNGVVLSGGESSTLIDKYYFGMSEDIRGDLFSSVEYVGVAPGEGGMNPEEFNAEAPLMWDAESTTLSLTLDVSDVSGLQDELNSKSDSGHNHDGDYAALNHSHGIGDVTNLQTTLNGKSDSGHTHTEYAATGHTHAISDVTNLQTTLNGKSDTSHDHDSDYAAASHNHAIGDVTNLQSSLNGKSDSGHNHDGDYAALNHNHDSDYAASSHTHTIGSVTNLQSELNDKLTATQAAAVADASGDAEAQLNALLVSLRSAGILAE